MQKIIINNNKYFPKSIVFLLLIIISNILFLPQTSFAKEKELPEHFVSIKVGVFNPVEEKKESGSVFFLAYENLYSEDFSFGFEIGRKSFKRDITIDVEVIGGSDFKVTDEVLVTSYPLVGYAKYNPLPDSFIQPYMGGGMGFSFNVMDFDNINKEVDKKIDAIGATKLSEEYDGSGGGGGLVFEALGGIKLLFADKIVLFVEVKYSYEPQLFLTGDDIEALNLGGIYALGGLGIQF